MKVNVPGVQKNEVPPLNTQKGQVCNEMIFHCEKNPLVAAAISARISTMTALVILISEVIASPQADANALTIRQVSRATVIAGDGRSNSGRISLRSGNGKFNKNYSTVLSPTINRGLQQVSNTNVSGKTNTQVAFCRKKHRVCKIYQKLRTSRW